MVMRHLSELEALAHLILTAIGYALAALMVSPVVIVIVGMVRDPDFSK